MEPLRISGKNLGQLAVSCPRCSWLLIRCGWRLPYQKFPGIFSSIDRYSKRVTSSRFERRATLPAWMARFGEEATPIEAPTHHTFNAAHGETGALLTGDPDEVLRHADGTLAILDYKTAKLTGGQDMLMPVYETQLNAYAWIAERVGLGAVSRLALIYYEPATELPAPSVDSTIGDGGFSMGFVANVRPIGLDAGTIPPLLLRARELRDMATAPEAKAGCKDCRLLGALLAAAGIPSLGA